MTPESIRRYLAGESIKKLATENRVADRTLRRYLREEGVTIRSKGRPSKNPPSRPPACRRREKFEGEYVPPPPPMTCAELFEHHNLSASERMLVYRMVPMLKRDKPVEDFLRKEGVTHPRRQYHLMTTAIAAAKEAGVMFQRERESA